MAKYRRKEDRLLSEWLDQQKTDPMIAEVFVMVLRGDGRLTFLQAAQQLTTSPSYHDAAREQDIIGLRNFVLGRVSKLWKHCQSTYRSRFCPDKRFSTDVWAKRLVYQLYKRMRNIWRQRCTLVMGVNGKLASKRERKALRQDIRQQFRLGPDGV